MGKGAIRAAELVDKLWAQKFRCALTGDELETHEAVPDHRLPLSRGGKHRIENIDIIRSDVNKAKGDMTTEEFVEMCRKVVKYANKKGRIK